MTRCKQGYCGCCDYWEKVLAEQEKSVRVLDEVKMLITEQKSIYHIAGYLGIDLIKIEEAKK